MKKLLMISALAAALLAASCTFLGVGESYITVKNDSGYTVYITISKSSEPSSLTRIDDGDEAVFLVDNGYDYQVTIDSIGWGTYTFDDSIKVDSNDTWYITYTGDSIHRFRLEH